MNTQLFCPISKNKIDEHVTRLNALFTFIGIVLFMITHNELIVAFLAIDFFLRSSGNSKISLMSIVSKRTIRYFQSAGMKINEGPKIFAARIGFVLSTVILLAAVFQVFWLAIGLSAVLGLFSFLEAAFGFCVACHIYSFLYRFGYDQ